MALHYLEVTGERERLDEEVPFLEGRGVDLVHRLGRLDLPRRGPVDPGRADARHDAVDRSGHPRAWPGYEITFRYHSARYTLRVENPRGVTRGVTHAELDGAELPVAERGVADVALVKDGEHHIRIVLG